MIVNGIKPMTNELETEWLFVTMCMYIVWYDILMMAVVFKNQMQYDEVHVYF